MRRKLISGMEPSPRARHGTTSSTASTKSTESDGDNSLLEQYFNKSGDLMVLRGQLEDLDSKKAEKLTQRELLRDQDELLSKSDEQFAKEYSDLNDQLQGRIKALQHETDSLRTNLETSGVDVNEAKWRTLRPYTVPESSTTMTRPHAIDATASLSTRAITLTQSDGSDVADTSSPSERSGDLVTRFLRLRSTPVIPQSSMSRSAFITRASSERLANHATNESVLRNQNVDVHKGTAGLNVPSTTRTSVPRHNEMSASKSTPTLLPSASLHLASQSSTALDSPQPSIYKTRRGDSLPDNSSSIVQTRDENQPRRYGSDMNGTYFDSIYGPTDRITDPELRRAYGVSARKRLAGTPNAFEHLDTSFCVASEPHKFFRQGKVFAILWAEPSADGDDPVTEITYNEEYSLGVNAKVRRFVVIRAMDGYCSALPITTNQGQGASMPGERKSDFAVIHTSKKPPDILAAELPSRGESTMRPMSIRIDPDDKSFRLDPLSRLHFGKVYTVDYGVKVKSIGLVNRSSMRDLLYQFRDVWKSAFTPPKSVSSSYSNVSAIESSRTASVREQTDANQQIKSLNHDATSDIQSGRPPSKKSARKPPISLAHGASGAVDALLSRGHSVDQILSAIGNKSHPRVYDSDLRYEDC